MKHNAALLVWMALFCLVATTVLAADEYPFDESLYYAKVIDTEIHVSSSVTLEGAGSGDKLEATMYYVPEEAEHIKASPEPTAMFPLHFEWKRVKEGNYPFGFTAQVTSSVQHPLITEEIPYPFQSPGTVVQYLQPQDITDTNKQIRTKAQELAHGKEDSVEVVFAIAQWVSQNVKYDLTSVTSQASQKSSWVYDNRYGVCDEITSLFISMSREAGIPARFVSGIAYTNLPEFPDHWGPHGWAEVWLPDVGWVPVDVTYGQIGFVDATHISIAHSLDSKNTAVDYSLLGRDLQMQAAELKVETVVTKKQGDVTEPLDIQLKALYKTVGSESGNQLTARVTNDAPYYVATDLYLVTTQDTVLEENRQQQLLLPPHATREVSWRVTTPPLQAGYEYTIPFSVIANRAGSADTAITGRTNNPVYPLPPEALSPVSAIPIDCEEPSVLYPGETASITCTTSSQTASLCTTSCDTGTHTVTFTATDAGAYPTQITARDGSRTGSTIITFVVQERPAPSLSATLPQTTTITESPTLTLAVQTAKLTNTHVTVAGKHLTHTWTVDSLESRSFELRIPATYLDAGENTLTITVEGLDKNGEPVTATSDATIALDVSGYQAFKLWLLHLFMQPTVSQA